jgi:hypothetical protein
MPTIYVKGICFETACMTMCQATNEIVIRTGYEKGEELKGKGGGDGKREGLRE